MCANMSLDWIAHPKWNLQCFKYSIVCVNKAFWGKQPRPWRNRQLWLTAPCMKEDGIHEWVIPALPEGVKYLLIAFPTSWTLTLIDRELSACLSPSHASFFTTVPLSSSCKDRFPLRLVFPVPVCRKSCSHLMMPLCPCQPFPQHSAKS